MIVTIDGPAGTGKSTVAFLLAERLGLEFLDTGAMYRALTLCALERGLAPNDEVAMTALADEIDLRFDFHTAPPVLLVNGRPVGERIRAEDVTGAVSIVASHPPVREALVRAQREIGREHPRLVTEGRDQGTVVFPDAELKVYLDARPDVRAHRRALQLRSKPGADLAAIDETEILNAILARDRLDSTRATGRMRRPDDAVVVDTSELTTDEVVSELARLARERLREAVLAGGADDHDAAAGGRA
ncbi:MAG: (d)CMP kinase [Phycisphaerae bacterium]|nr:(d)CMP kinase [Phycisphaerae bacterium]